MVDVSLVLDMAAPVMMLVVFLATAPWGRKVWWMADTYASFTFALGLMLIPDVIAGFQVSQKLDFMHHLFLRQLGAQMAGAAIGFWLCRRSVDERMFGSCLLARAQGLLLMLVCQTNAYYHTLGKKAGTRFNEKYLYFGVSGVLFWALGCVVQVLRGRQLGGYIPKSNFLQFGLYLDHFFTFLWAVVLLMYPSQVAKWTFLPFTSDTGHVTFLRCGATFLLAHSLISLAATGFLYARDKKAHLWGRISTVLFTLLTLVFAFYSRKLSAGQLAVGLGGGTAYMLFLFSLLNRFDGHKEK